MGSVEVEFGRGIDPRLTTLADEGTPLTLSLRRGYYYRRSCMYSPFRGFVDRQMRLVSKISKLGLAVIKLMTRPVATTRMMRLEAVIMSTWRGCVWEWRVDKYKN
jgi:hypothetical protein